MKKIAIFSGLTLLLILSYFVLTVNTSLAKNVALPPFIEGTRWTGNLTFVHNDGSDPVQVVSTMRILNQWGDFFSGQLEEEAGTALPDVIPFSGFIGPVNDQLLHMTAQGIVTGGSVPRTKGQKTLQIYLRGRNVNDGSTFVGTLTQTQ